MFTHKPTNDVKSASYDYYDSKKNLIFNKKSSSMKVAQLNKDLEPFGFAYYPKQDIFYSVMDGWQRDCGYCELYDEAAAALCMIIDCEPIRFEYDGKKWLLEFWKGQYGMTTGCEIGVYTTTGPNLNIPEVFDGTFYYSADNADHLNLAFSLRKHGSLLFTRSELHWWLTGFKLGEFSDPSELEMSIELTLKDSEMCKAFINGMLKAGYSTHDLLIKNTTVQFILDKPHSPQPASRTSFTESFMQTINKRNCQAYQEATKNESNTLDKLELIKVEAPKMYRKIINVGSTKELFGGYKTIQNFLNYGEMNNE